MATKKINKSAKTGRFVSEKYLEQHPDSTFKETVRVPKTNKNIKKK